MKALLVVDVQYDFMPGGALGVREGDLLAPVIDRLRNAFDLTVFTQDWHPADHCSFSENGGPWPVHCVQGTRGAAIDERILRKGDLVVQKGVSRNVDSYSGFWDNARKHQTGLDALLKGRNIDTLYVCGLATDYSVRFTALDGIEAGYRVFLIEDACRGVDVKEGDSRRAVEEMRNKGVTIIASSSVINRL